MDSFRRQVFWFSGSELSAEAMAVSLGAAAQLASMTVEMAAAMNTGVLMICLQLSRLVVPSFAFVPI